MFVSMPNRWQCQSIAQPQISSKRLGPRIGPGFHEYGLAISETEVGNSRQELLQAHSELHPRHMRAEAAVDAGTERDVRVVLTIQHDVFGIAEPALVAVGRRDRKEDRGSLGYGAPGYFGIRSRPSYQRDGRVDAEELFDSGRHEQAVAGESLAGLGILG